MGTKLERIVEISATTPKPEFTSLYHLINIEMLKVYPLAKPKIYVKLF